MRRIELKHLVCLLGLGLWVALLNPGSSTTCHAEDATSNESRAPIFLLAEANDDTLLILNEKSGTLMRMNRINGEIEQESYLGEEPFDLTLHPDGQLGYVSCRRGQEIVEFDVTTLEPRRHFPLRGDPTGVAISEAGDHLYVGVHSLDQIAVFDLESGLEIKRFAAGNAPEYIRRAPDGRLFATSLLSNPMPPDELCRNEITVIDDPSGRVTQRIILPGANIGRQIVFTPDGSTAIASISRPKNLVPMVQVARGWVVTNGFVVLSLFEDLPPVQLLIDLPNQSYADPYGVTMMPDGKKFYMSAAGSDAVLAVDLERVRDVMHESLAGEIQRAADQLGLSRRYVTKRIVVGTNPQAMTLSGDGSLLFVANRLDDSITVIDTGDDRVTRTIGFGTSAAPDRITRGERLFFSADRTFQDQFSCGSCHPDNGFDGLSYDLEPDGLGMDVLDNRNMRGVRDTGPFKWVGTNPDITTQCGTRTAKWIVRTGWLGSSQVVDLTEYIHSLGPVINPYANPDGTLTAAQRRGKAFFERTTTNDGQPIPEINQCHFCHSGPDFTNFQRFDVGTQGPRDRKFEFDTAHLTNIFESPPYLHDGRAATLEEIWTMHNPDDRHGFSSDWTKQQLNDLVEYMKVMGAAREDSQ